MVNSLFPRPILLLIAGVAAHASVVCADSAAGVRERKVDVGEGVSVRVIKAGQGGSTLVFIPGWSTGADIWQRQIETFANTGHVISFDPRSQGESTKTTSGNTPEMCAGPPAAVHNLSGRNSQANFLGKISARRDEIFHCTAGWNRPRQIEQTERQHSCEIS